MPIESIELLSSVSQISLPMWIGPAVLFGIYYGFLTTLPIGLSQIFSIRSFLLEGNLSGTVAVSGSMIGQLLIYLSIYCSPMYILLVKPHLITLLVLPYMFFHWFRTKYLLNYKNLRYIGSISDPRLRTIFLDSLIFQLLNPLLLPSPVLSRLVQVVLYRYSNNLLFIISSLLGWLGGNLLFINLAKLLLVRIEHDAPILYLLIKRVLYRTFSIIISICLCLHLGRAPVPLTSKKFLNEITLYDQRLKKNPENLLWIFLPWPNNFFDRSRWNRPLRYIENSRISHNSLVKKQVSDYFFNKCVTDGKQRISFTYLPSLFISEKQLKNSFKDSIEFMSSDDFYKEWISDRLERRNDLNNNLKNRIESLKNGSDIHKIIEKRTGLYNSNGQELAKIYDPFLSSLSRTRIPLSKSPWILSDIIDLRKDYQNKDLGEEYKKEYQNKFKDWISNQYQGLSRKLFPLPWDLLPKNGQRTFLFMFGKSKDKQIKKLFNELNFLKTKHDTVYITWEHVFKLPPVEQALFFIYLKDETNNSIWSSFFDVFSTDFTKLRDFSSVTQAISLLPHIQEIKKDLPRYTLIIKANRFDVVGGTNDVRQRKVKNVGISVTKTKQKTRRVVKRFSKQSDFRRRILRGSSRPRRRKILIWKMLQHKAHSPFFLRIMETPTIPESSLEILETMKSETNTIQIGGLLSPPKNITRSKADRLALAARLDFYFAQSGRSLLLVTQSNFRKYVKLPILIIGKNIGRILLFQFPEWDEDWTEWNREIHIKCTYDGNEFSDTKLPGRWLREGLQIKILYPFQLKPWHTQRKLKRLKRTEGNIHSQSVRYSNLIGKDISKQQKVTFCYLTAWGFQTNLPFGIIKKQPSFWKPVRKKLIKDLKNNISLGTKQISQLYSNLIQITNLSSIYKEFNNLPERYIQTNRLDETNKSNIQSIDTQITNEKKTDQEIEEVAIDTAIENLSPNIQDQPEFETQKNIWEFKDSLIPTNDGTKQIIQQSFLHKIETRIGLKEKGNKDFNIFELILKKQLVQTQQRFLRLRRINAQLIRRGYYLLKIIFKKLDREIYNHSISFLRFNIQLIILLKDIFEDSNKIQHTHSDGDGKVFRVDRNKSIKLISHAYILDRLWQTKTTKLDLNYLVQSLKEDSWVLKEYPEQNKLKSINYLSNTETIISEDIEDILITQGIIKEPQNFSEKDWNEWLHCLRKYNLSSGFWSQIAPKKWRFEVNRHWKIKGLSFDTKNEDVFYNERDTHSIYRRNPLLKQRINNFNKRYKYNTLLYSFVDFVKNSDIKKLPIWKENTKEEILATNRIQKIRSFGEKKKKKNILYPQITAIEKKNDLDFNLMLWLFSEFIEETDKYGTKTIFVPKNSILQKGNKIPPSERSQKLRISYRYERQKIKSEELSLRERKNHYYLFQWRWRSKKLGSRMQRIKDLASLLSVIENQQDLTGFCREMKIDVNLLNLFFTASKKKVLDQFLTISSHRLPKVLDDQILMYKMVSTLLKFIDRFERRIDGDIFSQCIPRLSLINDKQDFVHWYNLEDLLLPRRRRELRVLRSLILEKGYTEIEPWMKNVRKTQTLNPPDQTQFIKRFLWPIHRLEDLACMNRFWFNTSNGSRFTMLRIRMYPPF
uniref:Protein TIC 214 n=1 Tax=Ptisana novoguineensis TaxID=2764333 RepID=A0A7G7YHW3_9MONI|nr:Ycf1 [Ptisana novoguineensis]QNH94083.1 Ycf1 [Ptisana novoguineensis]